MWHLACSSVGMHILVTGGSGVIGAAAVEELVKRGHRVRLLSRHGDNDAKRWNDAAQHLSPGCSE